MTLLTQMIELRHRVNLNYVEQGDPSGIPVVFLHGYSDSWRSYERILPYLPPTIHAFALSQRGHGDSDRPPAGYRPQDFAADVAAFLDAKQIQRAVIVGHSMGSIIARRFAIDHPERTQGLVLVDSFYRFRDNPGIPELEAAVMALTDPVDAAFVREFQLSTLAQPVPADFFEAIVAESLKLPARVWHATLKGLLDNEFSDELAKIKAPTLILWGDQDAFCPRSDQDALLAAIPNSELIVYEGVGHDPQWEQPARFASDIANFVDRLLR